MNGKNSTKKRGGGSWEKGRNQNAKAMEGILGNKAQHLQSGLAGVERRAVAGTTQRPGEARNSNHENLKGQGFTENGGKCVQEGMTERDLFCQKKLTMGEHEGSRGLRKSKDTPGGPNRKH